MTWLPFTNLGHQCRAKVKYPFIAFPMLFMFLSFEPLFSFGNWLGLKLGIVVNAPIKGQPNEGWFSIILILSFVLLMLVGYLFGFVVNAIILRVFFNWPSFKLKAVFIDSILPVHWYKPSKVCPKCNQPLGTERPGTKTFRQALWGGWTCPNCKCDVKTNGKPASA